jgi:pilus assembly protein Flp/PilA
MLFLPREEGQGLTEYAMILILIAIIVLGALLVLGPQVGNMFSSIVAEI